MSAAIFGDWGTSRLRLYLFADGEVVARREAPGGSRARGNGEETNHGERLGGSGAGGTALQRPGVCEAVIVVGGQWRFGLAAGA